MPTALQMISRSMRLIGALGGGETPTADEQTDGLAALNAMLDGWDIQPNAIHKVQDESFTWAVDQASQTLGSGGDFNTTRPARIVGFYQTQNSFDFPIDIATEDQYRRIGYKTTGSTIIQWIYPEEGFPLYTLYGWPVPSAAATIHVRSHVALQDFSAATTALSMPPGYEEALVFNLALRLAPEYQRAAPDWVAMTANKALRSLKTKNLKVPNSTQELAAVGRRASFNIYVG